MFRKSFVAACVVSMLLAAACASDSPSDDGMLMGDSDASAPADASVIDGAGDAAPPVCSPDTWTDPALVASATRSPDGEGWCCERSAPTCECGRFGGFVEDRCECGNRLRPGLGICDLAPPDWLLETDAHGCSFYRARFPTTACCGCQPSDAAVGS